MRIFAETQHGLSLLSGLLSFPMLSCMAFVNRVLILHRKRACPRGEICTAFFFEQEDMNK